MSDSSSDTNSSNTESSFEFLAKEANNGRNGGSGDAKTGETLGHNMSHQCSDR